MEFIHRNESKIARIFVVTGHGWTLEGTTGHQELALGDGHWAANWAPTGTRLWWVSGGSGWQQWALNITTVATGHHFAAGLAPAGSR